MLYSFLVVLAVIVAVLLSFIVLIQESKGGGLASNFASSNQIMGVRKTTDVVEKATWTLAAVMVVLSIATSYVTPQPEDKNKIVEDVKTAAPAPMNIPGQQQQGGKAAPAAAPANQAPQPAK